MITLPWTLSPHLPRVPPRPREDRHRRQVSHDRERLTTFSDRKLFAIMKDGRERGTGGVRGADVPGWAAPRRRLSWWPLPRGGARAGSPPRWPDGETDSRFRIWQP